MSSYQFLRFLFRGGNVADLVALNETPLRNEGIAALDIRNLKLGDGTRPFNDLEWLLAPWAVASGTNTITATFDAPPVYFDGMLVRVRAAGANTSTATFNPNSLGALDIRKTGGNPLSAGDIAGAGHELLLVYRDSPARWELLNPAASSSGSVAYDTFVTTWDPSDLGSALSLSGGNLVVTHSSGSAGHSMVRATKPRFGGKWYWEIPITTDDANHYNMIGLALPTQDISLGQYPGSGNAYAGVSLYGNDGKIYRGGATLAGSYSTFAQGDVIGCAWDADNGYMDWSKNNTWMGRNPGTGKIPMVAQLPKGLIPAASIYQPSSAASLTGCFARASFTGTIPAGFAPYDND